MKREDCPKKIMAGKQAQFVHDDETPIHVLKAEFAKTSYANQFKSINPYKKDKATAGRKVVVNSTSRLSSNLEKKREGNYMKRMA
jgi:hypothetical protein